MLICHRFIFTFKHVWSVCISLRHEYFTCLQKPGGVWCAWTCPTPPSFPSPAPLQSLIRAGMPRVAAACRNLWPQRGSLWPAWLFFSSSFYIRLRARWGRQKCQGCQPGGGNKCSCSYSLSPLPYTDYRRILYGWVQSSTLRLSRPTVFHLMLKRLWCKALGGVYINWEIDEKLDRWTVNRRAVCIYWKNTFSQHRWWI